MREDRLVRALETLDDLLEVLEHVPDALGGIGQVVEVDVEILGQIALLGALQGAEHGALRADDGAEVDDLLLDVAQLADDLGRPATLEDVVLQAPKLAAELAEHREAGVDGAVEDLVEQEARSLAHDVEPHVLARAGALEQRRERNDLLVRQRDDVVGPDEDVELGRVQPPGLLVEAGELHDEEEVLVVLVDLGPLVVARDVLEVELVEVELLCQPDPVGESGLVDVDPAQPRGLDDLGPGLAMELLVGRRLRHRPARAEEARHPPSPRGLFWVVHSTTSHRPGEAVVIEASGPTLQRAPTSLATGPPANRIRRLEPVSTRA